MLILTNTQRSHLILMTVYVIMTTYVSKIGCIENDSQNPKLTQKSGKS